MRTRLAVAAALPLLAACIALKPLRPADPAQVLPKDHEAATSAGEGVRIVVRPDAWGGGTGVEDYLTPVEVEIVNESGRPLRVQPASFTLLAPNGFRYAALSTDQVRRALGPYRGAAYGGYGYVIRPWGFGPYAGWGGPWGGRWSWGHGPGPWWGGVPYYGFAGVPSRALAQGTLDTGGHALVLVFFPVAQSSLTALEIDANLVDTSGQTVAALRVPFVRGNHPAPTPLAPTAAPQQPAQPPGSWRTEPPPNPPPASPPPPPAEPPPPPAEPPPPVDTPIGPAPDAGPR